MPPFKFKVLNNFATTHPLKKNLMKVIKMVNQNFNDKHNSL